MYRHVRVVGCILWFACAGVAPVRALPVTGLVVDAQARPVEGVEVVVCEQYRAGDRDTEAQQIGPVSRTDSQGRFSLEAAVTKQREVFVVARKVGFAHAWEWLNCSMNTVERKHFLLVLEPPGVLAGRVVDADGKPAVGAEVQAIPVKTYGFSAVIDRWAVPGPRSWFAVKTDAQGRFRFEQLPADASAALRIQAEGSESRYAFRLHIMESCGFAVGRSDLLLALPQEGAIHGRTVDSRGRPVGGVDLMIRSGRSDEDITNLYIARQVRSDPAGTFTLKNVPEGRHVIAVVAPEGESPLWTAGNSRVSVKAGEVTETTIHVARGGVLEVTVLDGQTRRPVPNATLGAHSQRRQASQSAVANAQGEARIRVRADSYDVQVSAPHYLSCQDTLQVRDGQTIRRQAYLLPFPVVSGRVLDPQSRPVRDIAVAVHRIGDHVYTDAQGRFDSVCNMTEDAKGVIVTARDISAGLAVAARVDDPSKPVDVVLGPAWTLTGRIVDPNGAGLPAARVLLHVNMPSGYSSLGVEVLTDPRGRFTMPAVPPTGEDFTYLLSISVAGYGPKGYLRISPSGPPGAVADLGPIELPPANVSASGLVVDAAGRPVPGVQVSAHDVFPDVEQPRRSTVTNDKGEFTLTGLCRGRARLQAGLADRPGGPGLVMTRLPAHGVKIVLGQERADEP